MEYFILNDLGELQYTSNHEPPHRNWTIIPYNGGLIKAIFNGSKWIETATEKEIEIYKELQIANLDLEYTQKINELVYVHVQKLATRNIPIPKEILDKQQELINEFYKLKL